MRSHPNPFVIQFQINILGSLVQFQIALVLRRFLGQEGEQMEKQVQTHLAVLDGDAEISQALQVCPHALGLAADEPKFRTSPCQETGDLSLIRQRDPHLGRWRPETPSSRADPTARRKEAPV
jgi:hypothetical protein